MIEKCINYTYHLMSEVNKLFNKSIGDARRPHLVHVCPLSGCGPPLTSVMLKFEHYHCKVECCIFLYPPIDCKKKIPMPYKLLHNIHVSAKRAMRGIKFRNI